MKKFSSLQEDLRQWFDPKHPKGGWKRINSKGEAIGPCAREPGEAKPKCMSNEKRAKLSKKERASAVAAKRKHDPNPERQGKPINVSNFGKGKISEDMEKLDEKNVPTSPEKWARAKAQAKAKFDVYPSAYANGWAAKKYKEMGGGWKSVSEAKDPGEYDQEGDMAKTQLRSIIYHAQELHDQLEKNTNLPEWVQSKITLAQDYVQTACDYMYSQKNESVSEAKEVGDDPINDGTPSLLKKKGNKMVNCSEEFAGWIAHYNGQKHEIKSHQAKDLYDAKKKAIEHFKVPKHKQGLLSVKPGYNEEVEPVNEITQKLAGNYLAKVTHQNLQKHGMQHDMYGKLSKNRQKGVANAFKRLEVHPTGEPVHHLVTKEDVQLNEALSIGDEVQCNKTFRYGKVTDIEDGKVTVKYKDGSTETGESNWWTKKILDEQLYKKARFVSGAGKKPFKAPIQATPRVDESRGHKVIATFFKNREIAQKAFTGQNKPVEKPQEKKVVKESRKAEIVKDIVKKKKKEVFNPEPVLGSTQVKADTVNTTTG